MGSSDWNGGDSIHGIGSRRAFDQTCNNLHLGKGYIQRKERDWRRIPRFETASRQMISTIGKERCTTTQRPCQPVIFAFGPSAKQGSRPRLAGGRTFLILFSGSLCVFAFSRWPKYCDASCKGMHLLETPSRQAPTQMGASYRDASKTSAFGVLTRPFQGLQAEGVQLIGDVGAMSRECTTYPHVHSRIANWRSRKTAVSGTATHG